jgi:hypothetical protein
VFPIGSHPEFNPTAETTVTEAEIIKFLDDYAALGPVPEPMLKLLRGEPIVRSMALCLCKGKTLSM